MRLLHTWLRRLRRRPAPDFAEALRQARRSIDPVPVRVGTLERALVSKTLNPSFPHAGAK
jgi:hypothetical protein